MHKVLNHAPSDQPQRLSANYIPVERSWHGMSVRSRKTIRYRSPLGVHQSSLSFTAEHSPYGMGTARIVSGKVGRA